MSIIEVNNLSKSFIISHEGQKERYTALRDVMAQKAKKLFSFPSSLRGGNSPSFGGGRGEAEEFWALKDVSFSIEQGDRVGIIGRNGAGKSTLLKILSRITEPTKGEIKIRGRVASLLEVGTGFHPELTGRENIYLNGAILGMSRAEIRKKFDEIVDFAEVERFLDTPVKRYSSGMYVRLAFAVAAHLEPEILVVDEVLAVGDAQFQKKCLGKMEDVSNNQGRTVLFVSHNMTAIRNLCKSGIYLNAGTVNFFGSMSRTLDSYLKIAKAQMAYHWQNTELSETDILNFSVENNNGSDAIDIASEILLTIELINQNGLNDLALEIFLYNGEEQLMFNAITPIPPGIGSLRIKNIIPSTILLPDTYKIVFGISQSFSRWIKKYDNTIFFEAVELGKRNIGFLGKWEGIIKPDIKTEIINLVHDRKN